MKIKYNLENIKKIGKRFVFSSLLSGALIFVGGCSNKVDNKPSGPSDTTYQTESHNLIDVDRNFSFPFGKNGKYALEAPEGYKIVDYDYDKWSIFEFNDYTLKNDEDVYVKNPNDKGTPIKESDDTSDIYEVGEHTLVDINRDFNMAFGRNDSTFELTAPDGYDVLDYDYDKTDYFDFENITYSNNKKVKVENKNDFGTVLEKEETKDHKDGIYDIGEHKIVDFKRNVNILWGKDEIKQVIAPEGYKIIDYDYDKTKSFEFSNFTYENTVPIYTEDNNSLGKPITPINSNNHEDGIYEAGEHVLIRIDRSLDIFFGYNGTRESLAPEGYEILDYDYDKNDDFEFETYVYVNNKRVKVNDGNSFGEVIENEKHMIKK